MLAAAYRIAEKTFPSRIIVKVSREKAEKVVNPPKTPVIRNNFQSPETHPLFARP